MSNLRQISLYRIPDKMYALLANFSVSKNVSESAIKVKSRKHF